MDRRITEKPGLKKSFEKKEWCIVTDKFKRNFGTRDKEFWGKKKSSVCLYGCSRSANRHPFIAGLFIESKKCKVADGALAWNMRSCFPDQKHWFGKMIVLFSKTMSLIFQEIFGHLNLKHTDNFEHSSIWIAVSWTGLKISMWDITKYWAFYILCFILLYLCHLCNFALHCCQKKTKKIRVLLLNVWMSVFGCFDGMEVWALLWMLVDR